MVQLTFVDAEVEQDPEGFDGEMRPTAAALEALGVEMREALEVVCHVEELGMEADGDDLLGVETD